MNKRHLREFPTYKPDRFKLCEKLCRIMKWEGKNGVFRVWTSPLKMNQLEELIERLKRADHD